MASENHYKLLKKGITFWNSWRKRNPNVFVDLKGANLSGTDLSNVDLSGADLSDVDFSEANLSDADLSDAILHNTIFYKADLDEVNLSGSSLLNAKLCQANLSGADLYGADLCGAEFEGVDLTGAFLREAILTGVNLSRVKLTGADLSGARLNKTNLTGADLSEVYCYRTDLSDANLTDANLQHISLVETTLEQTILSGCKIYGLSVWNLKGIPKGQTNLIITPDEELEITVDDLQLAQFVYLILNNTNIRNVINTITSKAVLILGRFTPERKIILDRIRQELRKYDYVPILFDFENTQNQSMLETVMTLSGMARFIIADVTEATMVRQEIGSIVEKYPSKPIQPILLHNELEFCVLPEITEAFKSILPVYRYENQDKLIVNLHQNIINPAEQWLKNKRSKKLRIDKTDRETALERENEVLKRKLENLNKK